MRLIKWGRWVRTGHGIRLSYPSISSEQRGVYGPSGARGAEPEDPVSERTDRLVARLDKASIDFICDWYVAEMTNQQIQRKYNLPKQRQYERLDRLHHHIRGVLSASALESGLNDI